MPSSPRRRWLQFSLRTMFVVVTVVAVVAGWAAYSTNWIRQRHALLSETDRVYHHFQVWHKVGDCRAPDLLWLFGESGTTILELDAVFDHEQNKDFENCKRIADSDLERARTLFPEAEVRMKSWNFGPAR